MGKQLLNKKVRFLMLLAVREERPKTCGFTLAFRSFNHPDLAGFEVIRYGLLCGKGEHLPWFYWHPCYWHKAVNGFYAWHSRA